MIIQTFYRQNCLLYNFITMLGASIELKYITVRGKFSKLLFFFEFELFYILHNRKVV